MVCSIIEHVLDHKKYTVLTLIRATREGNWKLHLAAIKQMIPWSFAKDKVKYARFLPYY